MIVPAGYPDKRMALYVGRAVCQRPARQMQAGPLAARSAADRSSGLQALCITDRGRRRLGTRWLPAIPGLGGGAEHDLGTAGAMRTVGTVRSDHHFGLDRFCLGV
jgi:hypothetical protein